jgi:hypothetical protein
MAKTAVPYLAGREQGSDMSCRQYSAVIVLGLGVWLVAWTAAQSQSGSQGHASGGGLVSPSVVATFVTRFTPASGKPVSLQDRVPHTLDLLVLWRGSPGWFSHEDLSVSVSDTAHRVSSRGRSFEVRIDPVSGTISLQGHASHLGGVNVLFVDRVDDHLTIAGTSRVDALLPPTSNGPMDIVRTIAGRSPEVFEYLRCARPSASADDVTTQIGLRVCEGLR